MRPTPRFRVFFARWSARVCRSFLAAALIYLAHLNCGTALEGAEVTAKHSEHGAVVRIDGKLFAEYRTRSGHQPAIWPIIGPTGKPTTRSFPIGPREPTERSDHPHHHSLWFAHQDVNGHDFWHGDGGRNVIKHLEFSKIENLGQEAVVVTRNRWLAGEENPICDERRTFRFGANDAARWIDFTSEIVAAHGAVTFGDMKDGAFSVRVAGTMKVDAGLGGSIFSSAGLTDQDAWGLPAEWVDYHGPVEGETVGIAIFSHPSNFQHPCRWHVRSYGLFSANPFGERPFPQIKFKQTPKTIAKGDTMTLRYRVFIHRGNTNTGKVREAYASYAGDASKG
ncbi:MAG: PmoA family protein [Pirellulales bacterium]|nr:PmoA family protein [Pirellulales bacterium]